MHFYRQLSIFHFVCLFRQQTNKKAQKLNANNTNIY